MRTNLIKRAICVITTIAITLTVCVSAIAETAEQRVKRIYYDWQDNWEYWINKELVAEYEINTRSLVVAIIEHESRFQGNVGIKYRGLMQISTSKDTLKFLGVNADSLYDEKTNVECGVKILQYYLDKNEGNIERALCGYGCGGKKTGYCRASQEIYILYKKYKEYFEEQEIDKWIEQEIEDREKELNELIEESENASEKLKDYYSVRIENIKKEIKILTEM